MNQRAMSAIVILVIVVCCILGSLVYAGVCGSAGC